MTGRVVGVDLEMEGSTEKFLEDDSGLESGQPRSDTEMDAPTEGDVFLRIGSIEIDLVRVRELIGVAIGRSPEQKESRVFFDPCAAKFGLANGHAVMALEGRFESQGFFNESRNEIGLGSKSLLDLGGLREQACGAAGKACGGFRAGAR